MDPEDKTGKGGFYSLPVGMAIIIFLAVLQGLTEFLPVSSSGHLVLAEILLDIRGEQVSMGIIFEIAVHVGTLGAIIMVYRRRVGSICMSFFSYVCSGFKPDENSREDIGFLCRVVIASIPAILAGIVFHDRITGVFNSPVLTSVLLVATGLFLLLSKARKRRRSLSWHAAIIIGLAQAVAMLPGCSRSGWTITTALLLGLDFEKAAEFSFILSIPAVCGALILEILTDFAYISAVSITGLAIGAAVAFISGWIALKLLLRIIRLGVFHRFAYYLLPAGSASFLYFTFLR